MRKIIFRGQTRRNGEKVYMNSGEKVPGNWVYGGVLQGTGSFSIIYGCNDVEDKQASNLEKHVVHTDTLGQYTGLTDKNGTKIFEGDIVKADNGHISEVTFHFGAFCCYCQCHDTHNTLWSDILTVIGNIHDNPELLKGGEE